jgi:hypothetical protein
VICLVLLLSAPQLSVAQQPTAARTTEQELHTLATRSGEVVELLKQLVSQRDEDLQLRRLQVAILALQLRSSAISDIEARIRLLEDRAATANEELAQLDAESDRIDTIAAEESIPKEERSRIVSKSMLEAQIEVVKQRVWLIESQIVDLQNELAAKRRDVDVLEETVMDGLGDF